MAEEDEKRLAKAIVDEFMTRIYSEIGKSVAQKIFWIGVAIIVAMAVWAGIIHIPQHVEVK